MIIKKIFSKGQLHELSGGTESIEEIDRIIKNVDINVSKKLELSGSLKFPKKVGKANILVESPIKEKEEVEELTPKKVIDMTTSNTDYFKKKVTGGKRKYNTNKTSSKKRNYNRSKKG